MRTFWLVIYYAFAKHLPKSTMPVLGKIAKWLRQQCAKYMFAECKGRDINLEQGAYIGNGRNFYVLGDAAIGKDFVSHNRIVTIRGYVMMGEEVMFQGGGHKFDNPDVYIGAEGDLPDTPLEIFEDVWIGANEKGFAIGNNVSYNINEKKYDNPSCNGAVMKEALGVCATHQGQQIHSRIPLIAGIGLPVHVDGHIGDQQQIFININ